MISKLIVGRSARAILFFALTVIFLTNGSGRPDQGVAAQSFKNPFPKLVGRWTGSGTIVPKGGEAEAIKCRVYYQLKSPSEMHQTIACSTVDSQRFIATSDTQFMANGQISGTWSESIFECEGSLEGQMLTPSKIFLTLNGTDCNGGMEISLTGVKKHSVSLILSGNGTARITLER